MLYARWNEVLRENRSRIALSELPGGRSWTFSQLAQAAETPSARRDAAFPSGRAPEFVIEVLRAWRDGLPVCPLDAGQTVSSLPPLPDRCAHLKLTSASTGAPRLVAFSAGQLAADADQIVATMGLRQDWPNVGVISLAHSYGFSNLVLPLLLHGIPLILVDTPIPEALRAACATSPGVTLPAVPALWKSWHEADAIPASVRLALSAGAPLPLHLEHQVFERHRLKIHNFYGATECGGIAYDATETPRSEEGSVGSPMRGVTLSIADDGCLLVQSEAAGLGYLPEDSHHLSHGRYLTRDLVERRGDEIILRGRATDLINIAGRKVAPEAIEHAVAAHPSVRACVVFGAPSLDPSRHEQIVAVVATQPELGEADLRDHAIRSLPSWQVPREWRFVPEIPINARGKVSRAGWRQRFLAGELSSPTPR